MQQTIRLLQGPAKKNSLSNLNDPLTSHLLLDITCNSVSMWEYGKP